MLSEYNANIIHRVLGEMWKTQADVATVKAQDRWSLHIHM